MRIINFCLIFLFLTGLKCFSQTFSYTNIPSETPRNCFFNSTTNPTPPITINGYSHYGISGGVLYTGNEFVLPSTNTGLGTAFGIYYPFNAANKYSIVVTASAPGNEGTSQLQVTTNSARTHSPTNCAPEFIGYISSGPDLDQTINLNTSANNNYMDFTIATDYMPSVSGINYLLLASKQYGSIGGNHYVQVKKITIVETVLPPPCRLTTLSGLTTTNITNTSATVSWNAVPNALSYVLYYKIASDIQWSSEIITSTNSYTLNNLVQGTTYDWKVKATCFKNASTDYSISGFTTLGGPPPGVCIAPASLNANPGETSAVLSWDPVPGASPYGYDVEINNEPFNSGQYITVASAISATNFTVSGLSPYHFYRWRVRVANCGTPNSYGTGEFSTTGTCGNISSLSASNITSNSALISWMVNNPNGWSVLQYKLASSNTWSCANICYNDISPYSLTGLQPNSIYAIMVEARCMGAIGGNQQIQITTPPSFTGKAEISQKTVNNTDTKSKQEAAADFTIFPAPAKDKMTLVLKPSFEMITKVQLVNELGNIISEIALPKGASYLNMDVSKYRNGLYLVRIIRNNVTKTQKIVIKN